MIEPVSQSERLHAHPVRSKGYRQNLLSFPVLLR
jgi:hypothetical protein